MKQKYYIPALSFFVLLCVLTIGFIYIQKTQVTKKTTYRQDSLTQPVTTQSESENPHQQENKIVRDIADNTTTTEFTIPTPSWALSEYTLSSSTQYVDNTAYLSLCEKNLIKKYTQQKSSHFVQVNLEDLTFKIPYADTEIGANIKIKPYKNITNLVKIEFGNWFFIAEGMPNDNSAFYNCLPEPQYEYTLSVMPEEWLESAPIFSLESTQEIINGKRITIVEDGGLYDTTHMFYSYNGYVYILSAPPEDIQEMREIISQIEPIK